MSSENTDASVSREQDLKQKLGELRMKVNASRSKILRTELALQVERRDMEANNISMERYREITVHELTRDPDTGCWTEWRGTQGELWDKKEDEIRAQYENIDNYEDEIASIEAELIQIDPRNKLESLILAKSSEERCCAQQIGILEHYHKYTLKGGPEPEGLVEARSEQAKLEAEIDDLYKQEQTIAPVQQSVVSAKPLESSNDTVINKIVQDYKEQFAEDNWYHNKTPKVADDGSISLAFKSPNDAIKFFMQQAKKGESFEVRDSNGIVMAIGKAGKLYHAADKKEFEPGDSFKPGLAPMGANPINTIPDSSTKGTTKTGKTLSEEVDLQPPSARL